MVYALIDNDGWFGNETRVYKTTESESVARGWMKDRQFQVVIGAFVQGEKILRGVLSDMLTAGEYKRLEK